ncbi:hypothetical protein C8R44DRAFT_438018 [Mycena epipterygia]|nr:hypothetical protein C8R44DRAFT_438018 [Mycena epipterygia]
MACACPGPRQARTASVERVRVLTASRMARRARMSGRRRAEQHGRTRLCARGDHASPAQRTSPPRVDDGADAYERLARASRRRCRCARTEWIWAACVRLTHSAPPRPAHHPEQRRARARSRPRPARPRYTRRGRAAAPHCSSQSNEKHSPAAARPRCAHGSYHPSARPQARGACSCLMRMPACALPLRRAWRRAQQHGEDTRSPPPLLPSKLHLALCLPCAHSCPRAPVCMCVAGRVVLTPSAVGLDDVAGSGVGTMADRGRGEQWGTGTAR